MTSFALFYWQFIPRPRPPPFALGIEDVRIPAQHGAGVHLTRFMCVSEVIRKLATSVHSEYDIAEVKSGGFNEKYSRASSLCNSRVVVLWYSNLRCILHSYHDSNWLQQ